MNQDKIFCETHRCTITVSGCLLRQERNDEKKTPPAWMLNKIPKDPRCGKCAQGKQVKKGNYKPYKEEAMRSTINAMYPDAIAKTNKGPGRPPKQETSGEQKPGKAPKPSMEAEEAEGIEIIKPEKTCRICGDSFPADREHFYSAPTCRDGLDTRCKECVRGLNLGAYKAEETQPDEETEDKAPEIISVLVDFTQHPDLYDRLERIAQAEFRTPELQLLAMIAKEA
jgi:hypothetical protein